MEAENVRSPLSAALRPSLTLVLGPAGAGKTTWAYEKYAAAAGRALLLVSSPTQAETVLAQLQTRLHRDADELTGSVLTFPALMRSVLQTAPDADVRQPIGRTFQRLILGDLIQKQIRPDDYLGKMRESPGFLAAFQERLREWKLACLTPDALQNGAKFLTNDAASQVKTQELARLFHSYEAFLTRNRFCDAEDLLRTAAAHLASNRAPLPNNANLLLVDGFYRFNRAQRELLAVIAGRGLAHERPEVEVAVTLPYHAGRPLLFAAAERTLNALRMEFCPHEIVLTTDRQARPHALACLEAALFAPEPGRERPGSNPGTKSGSLRLSVRQDADSSEADRVEGFSTPNAQRPTPDFAETPITLFDAPNPYVEAEMVAREFRRLHDTDNLKWDDFAVILRTLGDYAPILSAVFERYDIPLDVDGPERLSENPLLKTLLHLLAIVRHDWQRDDVLAFLKSSYTAPDKLAADALRRRARAAGVREGHTNWLALVEKEGSEHISLLMETLRLIALLDARLQESKLPLRHYEEILRETLGAFGLLDRIHEGDTVRARRDRAALEEALETLKAFGEMADCENRAPLAFAEFYDALLPLWENASVSVHPEGERVRVAEPYDARERPLKIAAVMGLTERVFPRRISEDPFLRDEERVILREAVGLDLEEQKARADDERLFFYLAVTAPSERLILSYPRSTDESDTLPSFYLDEVRSVFTSPDAPVNGLVTVSRTLADVAPLPEESVSDADRLLAACAELFDPTGAGLEKEQQARTQQAATLMENCLHVRPETVKNIVASRRLPRLPRLEQEAWRRDFAHRKDIFSVSELETYRRCPFQYLLQHVLRLRPDEDDFGAKAQGTLLHSVLRRYFRKRKETGKTEPIDREMMQTELREILAERMAQETLDASPYRLRMTERMLNDALDGFAEREAQFNPLFNLTPSHFELSFGFGEAGAELCEEEERDSAELRELNTTPGNVPAIHDGASRPEPLCLKIVDGGPPVRLCGTIDRVDLDTTGSRALLMDYKLGKAPDYKAIQNGESLQMPLYLLAMEEVFGKVGAVGCYDSMREPGRPRLLRPEHAPLKQFRPVPPLESGTTVTVLNRDQFAKLMQDASSTAVQIARSIATASIEAKPGDHCRHCAYVDICRTTRANGHDGETEMTL